MSRVAFTIVEALAIRLRSLRATPIFLSRELSRIDNLTMYVLLYPLESIHPGATEKSIRIWCSPIVRRLGAMLFSRG